MPKRDPEHMQAQKERILRAAIECIADKGPERTSIPDICKRSGLSTGAIYLHFANKGAILTEALRQGGTMERLFPESWQGILDFMCALDGQIGFSMETVIRFRMHMHAEGAMPGPLHDMIAPLLCENLSVFAQRLQALADRGEIALRMSAEQTASCMAAFVEGALWLALSTDRPLTDLAPELRAGLACFVVERT